jgi:hypothetical protein
MNRDFFEGLEAVESAGSSKVICINSVVSLNHATAQRHILFKKGKGTDVGRTLEFAYGLQPFKILHGMVPRVRKFLLGLQTILPDDFPSPQASMKKFLRLPMLSGRVISHQVCVYTLTRA